MYRACIFFNMLELTYFSWKSIKEASLEVGERTFWAILGKAKPRFLFCLLTPWLIKVLRQAFYCGRAPPQEPPRCPSSRTSLPRRISGRNLFQDNHWRTGESPVTQEYLSLLFCLFRHFFRNPLTLELLPAGRIFISLEIGLCIEASSRPLPKMGQAHNGTRNTKHICSPVSSHLAAFQLASSRILTFLSEESFEFRLFWIK